MEKVTPALPSRELLEELVRYVMPFGKYKGQLLVKLPEAYLAWFARNSMPKGKLGELIETALVVRHNGLDALLQPLLDQNTALRREPSPKGPSSDEHARASVGTSPAPSPRKR